jgi:hypothetical protein
VKLSGFFEKSYVLKKTKERVELWFPVLMMGVRIPSGTQQASLIMLGFCLKTDWNSLDF